MPDNNVKLLDIQWVCSFYIFFIFYGKTSIWFIDLLMKWIFFGFWKKKLSKTIFQYFFPNEFQRNWDSLIFDSEFWIISVIFSEYRNKWKLWCAISKKNINSVRWNQNEIWIFHPNGLSGRKTRLKWYEQSNSKQ